MEKRLVNIIMFYLTSVVGGIYAGSMVAGGIGFVLGMLIGHYAAKAVIQKMSM